MTPEAKKARALLVAARYYVSQPGGWGRMTLGVGDGPRCLIGAMARAAGDSPYLDPYAPLYRPGKPADDRLWEWNDAPGRTQNEVITLFDNAIDLLERGLA